MPTRRSFLLGGAAVVGASGFALEVAGVDRVLRRLGLRESPDHRVARSGWSLNDGTLASPHMAEPVAWRISRPPGEVPLDGAIVCLHGRGENHRFVFDVVYLHDVVAALGLPLGVAAVDGGTDSYWHRRRNGTDAGAMLLDDFVPLVQRQLGVERVAVVGWSMGGYGALLAAERSPDLFDAVALASPALWLDAGETAPGAFDGRADYERNDVFAGLDELDPSRVAHRLRHTRSLHLRRARAGSPARTRHHGVVHRRLSRPAVLALDRAGAGSLRGREARVGVISPMRVPVGVAGCSPHPARCGSAADRPRPPCAAGS